MCTERKATGYYVLAWFMFATMQYKWFTLCLHRDVSHTDMLQLHFISCRGLSGAGSNMRGSRDFCQSYLVLSLFYSLQGGGGGPMVLLLRKLYFYFTKDPEGVNYFLGGGGGVKLFPGGSKC